MTPLPCVARIAVHRLVLRDRHDLHCRHSGVYSGITWSPFFTDVTPGPTSTTTPAPSCPKIAGNSPSGSAPDRVNSSVWHTPVARVSTSTSKARGPSSWTVSITSGLPASYETAARTSIDRPLAACPRPAMIAFDDPSSNPSPRNRPMPLSMYDASVPVYTQMLGALDRILAKAEAHAEARRIDPKVLAQLRLFPDMLPLASQVRIACDTAKLGVARITGIDA